MSKDLLDAFNMGLGIIEHGHKTRTFGVWYKGKVIDTIEITADTELQAIVEAAQQASDNTEVEEL